MSRPATKLSTWPNYHITALSDGDTTQAEIGFTINGKAYSLGRGEARRRPGDQRNRELGQLIALRRAFKEASLTMLREIEARGYDTTGL
ncbi:dsRBD fold-containing protein [Streptomyces sp. NPDC055085]